MSATVSGRSRTILIKVRNSLTSKTAFTLLPKAPIFQCSICFNSSYSSNRKCDPLEDFLPFKDSNSEYTVIKRSERRSIVLGLGKMIKNNQGFILKKFSRDFCPFLLVNIMSQFGNKHTAFAFFKFVFREESDTIIKSCCLACHVLAMQGFRIIAQQVLSWMIYRIGLSRGREVMGYMWKGHFGYESDFSVLDSLMRAFMNLEMHSHALHVMRIMRRLGFQPCLSAITILIKLLLRIGDYGSVWKLFREMIFKGPHPSNITFNVMILGFCKKGQIQIGESLLHSMTEFQCEPDVYTYNILINAYCIHGKTQDAWNWVELMIKRGCKPSNATFSTIINAFSKEGNIEKAKDIFDQMQEKGVTPNIIVYNALMDGYIKAGKFDQASYLLDEMNNKDIKADGVTFNILEAGYYKYDRDNNIKPLLTNINYLLSDNSSRDVDIARLCWDGQPDEATKLLEDYLKKGLHLTVISFNSIISAYSKKGLETKAFDVYRMMLKYGFTPSSSTCNSLLMCLSRNGKLLEAEDIMYYMKEMNFPVNKVAFTVIIDGYFKIGDLDGAKRVWADMENKNYSPDTVTYSSYIDGLSKANHMKDAYNVFLQMKKNGVFPNNFTYNSLIAGFCNAKNITEALKLEKEMSESNLYPDIFTNNIIINAFCKQGRMKSAIEMYLDMPRFQLLPDIATYNTLLGGYCKRFDLVNADNLISTMCMGPDVTTYNIRIHGLFRSRRIYQGVMVFNRLLDSGIVPNTITYNTILNAVCNDIFAMVLTAKLVKMAFVPNIVTINLLLSHLRKQGFPDSAVVWGKCLKKLCVEFDEVTNIILERAEREKEEDVYFRGTYEKELFLDFLMRLTYNYLKRVYGARDGYDNKMIESGSVDSSCGHQQPLMLEVNK